MNYFAFARENAYRQFGRTPMRDPIETDPFVVQQREDEAAREARWTDFADAIAAYQQRPVWAGWTTALRAVSAAMDDKGLSDFAQECQQFAETEGWSGVVTAIGRAMREQEQAQRELESRR